MSRRSGIRFADKDVRRQLNQWQCCISGSTTYVQQNMPAKPLKTMMSSDMDEDLHSFLEPIASYVEPAGDAGTRCAS
jgi:hypothetical protein